MCNTWFPTPTMGTRTRLSVTLYVHCLSCSPSHRMNSGFYCETDESSTRLRDRQPRILGSTPSKGTVFFYLFQSDQTVCGTHPASCSVGAGNILLLDSRGWGRRLGSVGDQSRASDAEVRLVCAARYRLRNSLSLNNKIFFFFTNDTIVLF